MVSKPNKTCSFLNTMRVGQKVLEGINTPRSLAIFMLADHYLVKTYDPILFSAEVSALGFNFGLYDPCCDYIPCALDYQATVLYSKLPPKPGVDSSSLKTSAIISFRQSEVRNSETNRRWDITSDFNEAFTALDDLGVPVACIREHLREILGRAPSTKKLVEGMSWSDGATALFGRNASCREYKAEYDTSITYRLAQHLAPYLSVFPKVFSHESWLLVPGNQVTTVPKNIVTDRTIAPEAGLNSCFQRTIGKAIASRLNRQGIDLSDQSNNATACLSAERNRQATLDMKNCSNSVCLFPILQVFPKDWADLLEVSRSEYYTLDSRRQVLDRTATWTEYSMLSSMGNGYTFEVETVLFLAIAYAVGCERHEVWVYGDDIIIPQTKASIFAAVCGIFGIEVNWEKSFTSGTFFESCGEYSFGGASITPFKIKELLHGAKDTIILANKIRVFAHLLGHGNNCDRRFLPAWRACVGTLPADQRVKLRGPAGSGLTLFCNIDEVKPRMDKKIWGLSYWCLQPKISYNRGKLVSFVAEGLLWTRLESLEGLSTSVFADKLSARGNNILPYVAGFKAVRCSSSSSWYNYGNWETNY